MKHSGHLLVGVASVTLAAVGLPAASRAQQADEKPLLEEIVVTGSKIKRTSFDSVQPAVLVDAGLFEDRGAVNVAEVLNDQPAFAVPGSGSMGSLADQNNGQNHVNCLGLGSNRTLTIVNGKRFVPSNSAANIDAAGLQVDLNAIPAQLIERVETIAVGGAPIYGTDAIACTVNIITKDDFEGFALNVQGGMSSEEGDMENYSIGLLRGVNFAEGRGNAVLSVEHSQQDGLVWADRPETAGRAWSFVAPTDPGSPYLNELHEDVTLGTMSDSGIPLFVGQQFALPHLGNGIPFDPGDPNSPLAQFDADGNLVPFVPGTPTGVLPIFWVGGEGRKIANYRSLLHDLEKNNVNLFVNYQLTDKMRLDVEGWYSDTTAVEMANEGTYQSVVFGGSNSLTNYGRGPIPVLLTNPFITPSTLETVTAALDPDGDGVLENAIDTDGDGVADAPGFFVDRNLAYLTDGAPFSTRKKTYRYVFGLEGEFELAGRDFSWETAYVYGRSKSVGNLLEVMPSRLFQATNAVRDPVTGEIVCADRSNGCVPFNPMVGPANLLPGAADFILGKDDPVSTNEQTLVVTSITGPIFELPAGPVRFAVGYDYRKEEASYEPSELDKRGMFLARTSPISGEYHTNEFYAELFVPITSPGMALPALNRLELEGAARRVDNSIAGADNTWTVGLRYSPIDALEFRANTTESIRAPATSELFLAETEVAVNGDDPCDARYIGQGSFPDRRAANCAADGIVQPFTSVISDTLVRGPSFTTGGNPDLENETAESKSIGVVIRPSFLPGLNLSFDWIEIDITDAIERVDAVTLMNACYDSAAFPNEPACDAFTRDASGQISSFRTGFVNIGKIEFAGLMSTLAYQLDTAAGTFDFTVGGMNTEDLIFTTSSDNPEQLAGQIGYSKERYTLTASWSRGPWRWYNQFNWISRANFNNSDTQITRDVKSVPSFFTWNTSFRYDVTDNLRLQLNVNNLLDEKAPRGVPQIFGGTAIRGHVESYAAGIFGRTVGLTARLSFR